MSYSKIFSDLPELTHEIIKYFRNDFSTLHSCILVNRLWCRLSIPLLWENPFSIPTQNYNFIGIYLHDLNDELKAKLKEEYKIDDNLYSSNTLFNYPTLLKYLYTPKIISSIRKWSNNVIENLNIENNSVTKFKRLILISLIKIFIENEVNIHTFEIQVSHYYYYDACLDDVLELMLQTPDFFHNIKNLNLHFMSSVFAHTTQNLILQTINLHQNLKKITLLGFFIFPLYKSLLLSKDHNHSNTLNTIILYSINFGGITNLDKAFKQLNVLETVHIIYCTLDSNFIQQIINLTKPIKLKSLFLNEKLQFDELLQLLQKYGDSIENFGIRFGFLFLCNQQDQQIELITKYCENIKFLSFTLFKNWIIHPLFNITENAKQNLNYLSISVSNNLSSKDIELSSSILRNLDQILPLKLEYLNLTLNIKYINDLEIFLKNSQNTFIKKLLIKNGGINDKKGHDIYDFIISYIKEYIMKKKRVKYLAIINYFSDGTSTIRNYVKKELFSLKNEVKEFELYDIKIQKYKDLVINSEVSFIEELEDKF
ncbi:uncharacterized protein OCT59_005902 [Rhizophagus irregularis]|uniref:F-box domain-containing protein n=1 Tax=Rhizophagus irregularis (strain DAOM 197198w) TaxID=1432141 RepID=A0A015JKQ7_RHIIW|nr:hypothetical protein RirG_224590 [Rhizophagus irregularis DAOM 197198w]UZO14445.1 hypothetical protein OCT59_005902 [Rhizophagus irregularis]GBC38142.1 hypothetical protein GLOIN_2v1763297 [Rhizophagus irregularis DAOM 181602=DAOM 197198]